MQVPFTSLNLFAVIWCDGGQVLPVSLSLTIWAGVPSVALMKQGPRMWGGYSTRNLVHVFVADPFLILFLEESGPELGRKWPRLAFQSLLSTQVVRLGQSLIQTRCVSMSIMLATRLADCDIVKGHYNDLRYGLCLAYS